MVVELVSGAVALLGLELGAALAAVLPRPFQLVWPLALAATAIAAFAD